MGVLATLGIADCNSFIGTYKLPVVAIGINCLLLWLELGLLLLYTT